MGIAGSRHYCAVKGGEWASPTSNACAVMKDCGCHQQKGKWRRGVSTALPTTATHWNHVWTCDFIADATVRGGAFQLLTILGEYSQ
jgi:hypothetical protein